VSDFPQRDWFPYLTMWDWYTLRPEVRALKDAFVLWLVEHGYRRKQVAKRLGMTISTIDQIVTSAKARRKDHIDKRQLAENLAAVESRCLRESQYRAVCRAFLKYPALKPMVHLIRRPGTSLEDTLTFYLR
jgi:predicted transcriptional regulator